MESETGTQQLEVNVVNGVVRIRISFSLSAAGKLVHSWALLIRSEDLFGGRWALSNDSIIGPLL